MERTELHRTMLVGASKAAEKAFSAISGEEFQHVPSKHKEAWLTATVIHCDLCRLLVAYEECERYGIARLLWMGDIASKLYEARNWIHQCGNPLLIELAGEDTSVVQSRLKEMRNKYALQNVEAYKFYRHNTGHHYSLEMGKALGDFSASDANKFFTTIANFVNYTREWVLLYKDQIRRVPAVLP